MTGEVETVLVEQPPVVIEPEKPAEPTSMADHAAKFSPQAREAAADAEAERKAHPSENQKRDKPTGQFTEGRTKHRAEKDKARPEDVPRIRELSGKLAAAEAELARLRSEKAPPTQIARAEQRVEAAGGGDVDDPEPQEGDDKYKSDYGKYLDDKVRWAARDEHRKVQRADADRRAKSDRQAQHDAVQERFVARLPQAREKYPDFDAVAMEKQAKWLKPDGSPTDQGKILDSWIFEDESGQDVLYFFQSQEHSQELDDFLRMSALEQVKRLTLLSQRLSSDPALQPADTRSGASQPIVVKLPPKPPNLVRTSEAQRAEDAPPPTDGSLSIAEHRKQFAPKSRRS